MEPIGQTLRDARERKGVTLQEAREALRIHAGYLDSLEAEEFDKLPAPAYARAFIRQYAAYLELDPEPLIAAYNACAGPETHSLNVGWSAAPAVKSSWSIRAVPAIAMTILALFLLGGVYGAHLFLVGKEEARQTLEEAEKARKAPVERKAPAPKGARGELAPEAASAPTEPGKAATGSPAEAKPAALPPATKPVAPPTSVPATPALPAPPAGAATPQPAPSGHAQGALGSMSSAATLDGGGAALTRSGVQTTVRATEKCWVRILADGKSVYEGTLQPGTERTWSAGEVIEMTMGNAGGVRLVVDGKDLGTAGRPGEVVRRVFRAATPTRVAGSARVP